MSGVAKGLANGAMAAVTVIVLGTDMYISSSRHTNDEDGQPTYAYEAEQP